MAYRLGKVNALHFNTREYPHEVEGGYIQKFHTNDTIVYQILSDDNTRPGCVLKCYTDATQSSVFRMLQTYQVNDGLWCFYDSLTGLDDGIYEIIIAGYRSQPFEVSSCDELLATTKLIKYTNANNKTPFANIFKIGNDQVIFQQRIECGFRSNGLQTKIEAETYRDQVQEIHHLYQFPYLVETLTFGDACGLPNYYADYINNMFCLDSIEIEGNRYKRSDSVLPSLTATLENAQSYIITLDVEKVTSDLEDIDGTFYRLLVDENGHYITDENGSVLTAEI